MSRILFLSKKARELGTYPVKFTVRDSSQLLVNSSNLLTISWWFTDFAGIAVNSRSGVVVTPANPFYVVLSGDDLQITDKTKGDNGRVLTVRGTYDSDYGLGLPFTYTVAFSVINELLIDVDLCISCAEVVTVVDTDGYNFSCEFGIPVVDTVSSN